MSSPAETSWLRLDRRVIWVDLMWTGLSLVPSVVVLFVLRLEPTAQSLAPFGIVAILGVVGGGADILRWSKTHYRLTDEHIELRIGFFVRTFRSIRRDRVRTVDTSGKFRHRLTGLRVVTVSAGERVTVGESSLSLDAVSRSTAAELRRLLLHSKPITAGDTTSAADHQSGPESPVDVPADTLVLARFQSRWVLYNILNLWAFLMAAGLMWGCYWTLRQFGVDLVQLAARLIDPRTTGIGWTITLGLAVTGIVGAVGLAAAFFTENWNFVLKRVPSNKGSVLRTSKGLFNTREVSRDDNRLRGVAIDEALLWRWMGVADTAVISTGLSVWSLHPTSEILPRGPVSNARQVAGAVLESPPGANPLETTLGKHPRAALRRRFDWALSPPPLPSDWR